ncbi:hypothetical protein GUJ93_ZPchr0001g31314 [Zizania palustris]|uniref:Uncharacterized protein n=1 Tax=Zizania palustris TaxID=103762 RepID=A0A8J5S0C0_ZIZPA|nr:hypothetical protein GUJ93_ZPchr0001g31314 [Zizania palustris]
MVEEFNNQFNENMNNVRVEIVEYVVKALREGGAANQGDTSVQGEEPNDIDEEVAAYVQREARERRDQAAAHVACPLGPWHGGGANGSAHGQWRGRGHGGAATHRVAHLEPFVLQCNDYYP